jgi:hypothetical protein
MKNIFFLLLTVLGAYVLTSSTSCVEEELFRYEAIVQNNSSQSVTVYIYSLFDFPPSDSVIITPNSEISICDYYLGFYAGFACEIEAFKYVFDNGKGYFCERGANTNNVSEICFFNDKNPFASNRLPNNGSGVLFTITQEDFENARELP